MPSFGVMMCDKIVLDSFFSPIRGDILFMEKSKQSELSCFPGVQIALFTINKKTAFFGCSERFNYQRERINRANTKQNPISTAVLS